MTTGRINQVAILEGRRRTRAHRANGNPSRADRRSCLAYNAGTGSRIPQGRLPLKFSASRGTAGGRRPFRVRSKAPRGWTTAPARTVRHTPRRGRGTDVQLFRVAMPSAAYNTGNHDASRACLPLDRILEEDRPWTVHRRSREPANTNQPNATHAPARGSPQDPPHTSARLWKHRRAERQRQTTKSTARRETTDTPTGQLSDMAF